MKYFERAIQKDISQDYIKSLELYEKSVQKEENIDAFINLSFLYWEISTEFAFRDQFGIPDKWLSIGADRYDSLLDQAIMLYSKNAEPFFWKKYFDHISLGEELTEGDVCKILESTDENKLIPHFFLSLFSPMKYQNQTEEIISLARKEPTAKNLYILSMLKVPS